jgi:hypothetical protein
VHAVTTELGRVIVRLEFDNGCGQVLASVRKRGSEESVYSGEFSMENLNRAMLVWDETDQCLIIVSLSPSQRHSVVDVAAA